MHQVLLGCVKKSLKLLLKSMSETNKNLVSKRLQQVKVNGANRNLRALNCVTDWKSSEFKLFLLYGFVNLIGATDSVHVFLFFILSVSIKLLLEVNSDQQIATAELLIKLYLRTASRVFGETILSINFHSLLQLPRQVAKFGHLFALSATPFESANHRLCKSLNMSLPPEYVAIVLSRRFLRNVNCRRQPMKTSGLKLLVSMKCI